MPFSRTQLSLVSEKGVVGVTCGKFIFLLLFSAWASLKPKATDFPLIELTTGRQSFSAFLTNEPIINVRPLWPLVRPTVIVMIFFTEQNNIVEIMTLRSLLWKTGPLTPPLVLIFFSAKQTKQLEHHEKKVWLHLYYTWFCFLKDEIWTIGAQSPTHFTGGEINVTLFCCKLDFRVQRLKNS